MRSCGSAHVELHDAKSCSTRGAEQQAAHGISACRQCATQPTAWSYTHAAKRPMVREPQPWDKSYSAGRHSLSGVMPRSLMMSNPVISSDKVEGTAVYNPNGEKLGSIDDLMIDKRSGLVRYAALEFGGFLGMGSDRYPVPWSMLTYDTNLNGYVVPLQKSQLEKAPRYPQAEMPDYDDDYGRKVYDYYGVSWQ
jgi:sporulation protein YlmC with PRC-barrel domain